jgi:hypothetical protein
MVQFYTCMTRVWIYYIQGYFVSCPNMQSTEKNAVSLQVRKWGGGDTHSDKSLRQSCY